jgi:hypothetical protein
MTNGRVPSHMDRADFVPGVVGHRSVSIFRQLAVLEAFGQ